MGKKGKKGKKGKAELEPEPETEPVVEVPVVDAGADDDWGGFSNTKKKKVSKAAHRSLSTTLEALPMRMASHYFYRMPELTDMTIRARRAKASLNLSLKQNRSHHLRTQQ